MFKPLFAAVLSLLSLSAHAELISTDWNTTGDNLITRDTTSGLDWLDLTETNGLSYNYVSSQIGIGGEFDGWRYASNEEVIALWDNFDIDLTGNIAVHHSGVYPNLPAAVALIGNIYPEYDPEYAWGVVGLTSSSYSSGSHSRMGAFAYTQLNRTTLEHKTYVSYQDQDSALYMGSYLVQVSAVPIPSAIWLFGSGLIGLIGLARRKSLSKVHF